MFQKDLNCFECLISLCEYVYTGGQADAPEGAAEYKVDQTNSCENIKTVKFQSLKLKHLIEIRDETVK